MTILSIFPRPIYLSTIGREFTRREKVLVEVDSEDLIANVGNMISRDSYILDRPLMKTIKSELENHLSIFFNAVYRPKGDVSIYITQSWINYTYPGQSHHAHSHENSFLSGVLYINAETDVDNITFVLKNNGFVKINPSEQNEYNSNVLNFPVGAGDIIIFPSDITHQVGNTPANRGITRVSLAFNSFICGDIGDEMQKTALRLVRA